MTTINLEFELTPRELTSICLKIKDGKLPVNLIINKSTSLRKVVDKTLESVEYYKKPLLSKIRAGTMANQSSKPFH